MPSQTALYSQVAIFLFTQDTYITLGFLVDLTSIMCHLLQRMQRFRLLQRMQRFHWLQRMQRFYL